MFAQVHILAILAVSAQSVFAATCSRTYTIKEGDFCDMISQAQNVSTYQLAAINPIINKDCTNLTPGGSICLGFEGEDCSTTQVVQAGDTCYAIASSNGLNMTIFRLNNPQLDEDCNIYIGMVLCTSGKVEVPAIPASGITVTVGSGQSAPTSTIIPNENPSPPTPVVTTPDNTPTIPSPTPVDGTPDNTPTTPDPTPVDGTPDNTPTTPDPTPVDGTPNDSPTIPSSTPVVDDPVNSPTTTPSPSPKVDGVPAQSPTPTIDTTTPSPTPSDNGDNYGGDPADDENLPFCDEL